MADPDGGQEVWALASDVLDVLIHVERGGLASVEVARLERTWGEKLPPRTPAVLSVLAEAGLVYFAGSGYICTDEGREAANQERWRRTHGG